MRGRRRYTGEEIEAAHLRQIGDDEYQVILAGDVVGTVRHEAPPDRARKIWQAYSRGGNPIPRTGGARGRSKDAALIDILSWLRVWD